MDPATGAAAIGAIGQIGGSLLGKKPPSLIGEKKRNYSNLNDLSALFALKRLYAIDPALTTASMLTGGKGGNSTTNLLYHYGGAAFADPASYRMPSNAYVDPGTPFRLDRGTGLPNKNYNSPYSVQDMGSMGLGAQQALLPDTRYKGFVVKDNKDMAAIDAMNAMFGGGQQANNTYGYSRPQYGIPLDFSPAPTMAAPPVRFGYGGGNFGNAGKGYGGPLKR